MLAGCSSGPKVPDWKINAIGHIERFTEAYLKGDERVEAREFALARAETARTGKPDQVARIELNRCAARCWPGWGCRRAWRKSGGMRRRRRGSGAGWIWCSRGRVGE